MPIKFPQVVFWLTAALLSTDLAAQPVADRKPAETREEVVSTAERRGLVRLHAQTQVDGQRLSELSGLAWDAEAQLLYAISDNGRLFRLRLHIENGHLRDVTPVSAVVVGHQGMDAEGLALSHTPSGVELLVATEGVPSVLRFDRQGQPLGPAALAPALADANRYASANAMLEAVTAHPVHGLLSAPERPLRGEDTRLGHRIYGVGRHWNIEALDARGSRLKAMDVVAPGQLLVLERSGSGKRLVSAVRRIDLDRCEAKGAPVCSAATLLQMDRDEGADNFEGMTFLGDGLVLLVSDNRGSKSTGTAFLLLHIASKN